MSHYSTTQSLPRTIVETLFRHRWKVILIPLLALAAAVTVIMFFPRTYHSEAIMFLQVGRESVGIDPTATTGKTIALQQSGRDDEVKSAIDVLTSRGVLGKTVDRLTPELVLGESDETSNEPSLFGQLMGATIGQLAGAIKDLDPISKREEAIIELDKSLVVETERGSTAIEVEIEADSPHLAQTILTELIEVYREEHARVHRNQSSQAFFQQQRDSLRQQLDAATLAVREAKDEMGIASIAGRRGTLEDQVQSIEGEKFGTEQALSAAQARAADLRQQLDDLPERVATSRTTKPNEGADLLNQEFYSLQVLKAELSSRYSDEHPHVVAVSRQLEDAKKVLDQQQVQRQETVDDINPIHQQLSLELREQQTAIAGHESRLETLNAQLQLVLQDLKTLNANELRIAELEREVTLREREFYQYAENLEQARIDQALEDQRISNISISQEPLLLEKPVSPSKGLVLLASLFLATAGTGAVVVASERLNSRLHNETELAELTGVPVLATIRETSRATAALAT